MAIDKGTIEDTGQGEAGSHAVAVGSPIATGAPAGEGANLAAPEAEKPTRTVRTRAQKEEEGDDGEMVQVPKKTLDAVLKRLDTLEDDNKLLKSVADKGRMARVEQLRAQGKLVKSVRIGKIDGNFVVGWKLVKDDVHFDSEGRLVEEQIIKVFFEDKTSKEMNVRSFANSMEHIEGEVTMEGKDRDGNISLTVLLPDGKEISIGQNFINP